MTSEILKRYCAKLYLRLYGCEIPAWLLARADVGDILFCSLYGVGRKKRKTQ